MGIRVSLRGDVNECGEEVLKRKSKKEKMTKKDLKKISGVNVKNQRISS